NYPPGPKGNPVLGNLLELPRTLLFLKLSEWAKEQGKVNTYAVSTPTLVIINSAKVAVDILDRSSIITGDRPNL
ncbi:hypothetical protein DACRYDRAFT_37727, partial [Dacryopinax primogenitus]